MNEYEELKALIDRVKRADKYLEQTLTDKQIEKALVTLQEVLKSIVDITLVLQEKYGRIDFSKLYVVEQKFEQLSIL